MTALLLQNERVPLWDVLGAFWSAHASAIELLAGASNWDELVIWIVVLAGLSEAIGQSVVLFANQVKPARFILSLIASALLFLLGFFLWVATFRLLVLVVLETDLAWKPLLITVGVSYIPLLFSFLGFLPYAGQPIMQLLYIWTYGLMVYYLRQFDGITLVESLIVAGVGVVVILLLRALLGRPIEAFANRVLNLASGARLTYDVDEAVARLSGDRFG